MKSVTQRYMPEALVGSGCLCMYRDAILSVLSYSVVGLERLIKGVGNFLGRDLKTLQETQKEMKEMGNTYISIPSTGKLGSGLLSSHKDSKRYRQDCPSCLSYLGWSNRRIHHTHQSACGCPLSGYTSSLRI